MSVLAEEFLSRAEAALDENGEAAVTFALVAGAAALVSIARSLDRVERELGHITEGLRRA